MSRSETMPRPVHSYESHHPDDIARRERDNSAFGNKVSRLKNVFQTENKGSSNHISYNRQNSKSPDIKRKRLPSDHAASDVISSTQKIPDPNVDPNIADPQKFFESTSHVQRFQYTRAIFAKMEEQNKREQERRRHFNVPSRERAISPTSPTSRSPVSINRQRLPDSKPPVDYSSKPLINNLVATKPRSSSDPSKMEQEADRKARLHGDGAEQLSPSKRADSVDALNTGESVGEKVTDKVPSARLIRQRYEEELKQKGGLSGSAPNLSSSYTRGRHNKPDTLPLDNDTTATQGPRSPPRPTGSPERPGIRTTYRTSPERLNSSSYQRTQVRTSLTSDDPTRGRPEPPQEKTDVAKRLSNEFDEAAAEQAGWEGEPAPQHRRFITRGDDNTPRKEHSYHRRVSSNEDKPVPTSVAHQDIITDVLGSAPPSGPPPAPPPDTKPEEVVVTRRNHRSNSSPPGGSASNNGGVLLPKRRSREDSSLSREEITASLHEADSYWKRMYGETVPETLDSSKMSDSTYSSGSGEEMARSESGHDLSEVKLEGSPTSPLSPMAAAGDMAVPRRPASWIARYQQQRNSRTSDPLEEKVTLGELNTRRTSQTSNSDAGSNRTSADMEERMNDKSGEVSSPVSRSSSESSSLPSVVKRLSTIEDPDIMNAPPSYPSPPPPVHPSPPPPSQSPSLYVTSPTGGEPDTGAEIRLGGFGGETDTDGLMEEEEESEYGLDERDTIAPLDPPSNAYLHANLGLKKTASPNESIDSMTPSEQDNLLSKT